MQMEVDPPSHSIDDHNNLGSDSIPDSVGEEVASSAYYKATEELKKSLVKIYPWILDFRNKCQKQLVNNNLNSLMKLINFYIKNVKSAVVHCYQKPKRAAKLKIELSYTLMFFHYTYKELKVPLEHFSYLEKMSELMAMHMDMELKASRNGNERKEKVASMITSGLKTFFGKYPEYILDSILKSKIITKKYHSLSDLIFRWVLRDSPETPLDIIGYIRYLLVYKRWKEIMCMSKKDQQQIIRLACLKLQPPVGLKERLDSNDFVRDLFPIIPKSEVTKFLMMAKFSSREKSKIFFKILETPVALGSLTYPSYSNESSSPILHKKGNDRVDQLLNSIWKKDITIKMEMEQEKEEIIVKEDEVICKQELEMNDEKKDIVIPEDKTEELVVEALKLEDKTEELVVEVLKPEDKTEELVVEVLQPEDKAEELISEVLEPEEVKDLDTSGCCMKSSDPEDETISSCIEEECMFHLIEDLNVGEGEHSSSLPLKKRRLISCNKFNKNDDNNDGSEMNNRQLPAIVSQSLDSKIPLNPSTSNSNLSYADVSNFCEPYKPCSSTLEWRNCEEYNLSECMNSEECYVLPPYSTVVNAEGCYVSPPYTTVNSEECYLSPPYSTVNSEEYYVSPPYTTVNTEEEERKIFKTPAQLKAFQNSVNEPPDLINLALEPHTDFFHASVKSYPVSREATWKPPERTASVIKRKAATRPRKGRKRGRPRKVKDCKKSDDSSSSLDELTTVAGFINAPTDVSNNEEKNLFNNDLEQPTARCP